MARRLQGIKSLMGKKKREQKDLKAIQKKQNII